MSLRDVRAVLAELEMIGVVGGKAGDSAEAVPPPEEPVPGEVAPANVELARQMMDFLGKAREAAESLVSALRGLERCVGGEDPPTETSEESTDKPQDRVYSGGSAMEPDEELSYPGQSEETDAEDFAGVSLDVPPAVPYLGDEEKIT
jgi:hypothetical protein